MKRIPLVALQTAVYALLTELLPGVPVYDDVPGDARAPYITFGAFACTPDGAKATDISNVTLNLDIWSDYGGKTEINTIADKAIQILTGYKIDLAQDGFCVIMQDVEQFEGFDDNDFDSYHGVVSFAAKIQNLKRSG